MKKLLYLIVILLLSCERDRIGPQQVNPGPDPVLRGRQVFMLNEGNFQRGNASIGAYTPATDSARDGVFRAFNSDRPLGDVAQDLQLHRGKYYVVLNNSGLVREIDTATWQETAVFSNLSTPRYISFYKNRAFVTELFANKIWVLDLESKNIDTTLQVNGRTGHSLRWGGNIVATMQNKLLIINPEKPGIDSSWKLYPGLERMRLDTDNNLWVLCRESKPPRILQLSPKGTVLKNLTLSGDAEPQFLSGTPGGAYLYYFDRGAVYRLRKSAPNPKPEKLMDVPTTSVYGMNVDPQNGDLYLSDALDFNQNADVYRFNKEGQLLSRFKGGAITNGFRFE